MPKTHTRTFVNLENNLYEYMRDETNIVSTFDCNFVGMGFYSAEVT
jgi:hypothetical protein